ncbi:hypothetical protein KSF_038670 [Reticulibacter mediterranei]|uniref:Uncharacterized protein n=1 Tax=Reticulibacter mediterranei TaxID=2778369 RepID=A0A8J3N042_9CHLR|nr:hypothetical protein [Reticulibacter mediterranei]GHO93819.1 hypothetical protein KSF_038670 [Reticulibacter mediterranei]
MLSRETERVPRILAWLSFWFDSSFELLDEKLFLPHGFFPGLGRVLQEVASDRLGRETLNQIQQAEEAEQPAWYPLIAHYLTEK